MQCTMAGCRDKATRPVAVPMRAKPAAFVGAYCDIHAAEVIESQPGAMPALGPGLRPSLDRGGA
jgi:hypothetical protein